MERWRGRVALVTGASSGIGTAVAKRLASHGMKVVATGRNLERLQELAKTCELGLVTPIQCDLTKENEILSMFERIHADPALGKIDVCINNAGLQKNAPLLTGTTEMWKEMFDVNVLALCICTREAVASMRNRGVDDGCIINICSMAGHRMIKNPGGHFYTASKVAVNSLTDGVNNELKLLKSQIRILQVSPGRVETEFFERAQGKEASDKLLTAIKPLQSEDIADAVVYGLSAPQHVQVRDILVRPTEQNV